MFDSPIDHCLVCRQMVVLDQTQAECAREHRCKMGTLCPLREYFTGIDSGIDQPKEIPRDKGC